MGISRIDLLIQLISKGEKLKNVLELVTHVACYSFSHTLVRIEKRAIESF